MADKIRDKFVKGHFLEILVREIFMASGYIVSPFGFESTVPSVLHRFYRDGYDEKLNKTPEALFLRRLPDFVVQDPDTGLIQFVEVKYRQDGRMSASTVSGYDKLTIFVLITPQHIGCVTSQELKSGKSINKKNKNYIYNRKDIFPRFTKTRTKKLHDHAMEFVNKIF